MYLWVCVCICVCETEVLFLKFSPEDMFFTFFFLNFFRERGREKEKHQCEKETLIGCVLSSPRPGIKPAA